jgi:CRISPR-associated protein Cas2
MSERAFYLITYDVPDDRRRLKVAKALEALGERVQYSVFEAWLTPAERKRLQKRLEKILDEQEDSLRIYSLCAACRERVVTLGRRPVTPPPGVIVL